jgi:hypothetical protein
MKGAAGDCASGAGGQGFGMQAGIGQHGRAFAKLLGGGDRKLVGLGHRAGSAIGGGQIVPRQVGLASLLSTLIYGGRDFVFRFGGRIVREGLAEVLHDVEPVSPAHHAHPDNVKGRVEQVRAMRRGMHETFVRMDGVVVEGYVFSLLLEMEMSGGRNTFGQGGLALELMGKLLRWLANPRSCCSV